MSAENRTSNPVLDPFVEAALKQTANGRGCPMPFVDIAKGSLEYIRELEKRLADLSVEVFNLESDKKRLPDEPSAAHSGDHLQRFTAWLVKEMPAGTVIGDPQWWARKLLAAACVSADEAPRQSKFDLAHEIMRQLEDEEIDTMQSCHFGYVLRVQREGAAVPPSAPTWALVDEYLRTENLSNSDRGILRRFAGWVDSRPSETKSAGGT